MRVGFDVERFESGSVLTCFQWESTWHKRYAHKTFENNPQLYEIKQGRTESLASLLCRLYREEFPASVLFETNTKNNTGVEGEVAKMRRRRRRRRITQNKREFFFFFL